MAVTAIVTATCKVGASALAFGAVTSAAIAAGNIDAVGNVSVNCTSGSNYTVSLDAGTGAGATLASHKMSAADGALLSYAIYTTAGKTTLWGDGTSGTVMVAGTGNGSAQPIPAYGRIFAGQIATAASFADVVNVTVRY
jgi:spore coat protein U-like protein